MLFACSSSSDDEEKEKGAADANTGNTFAADLNITLTLDTEKNWVDNLTDGAPEADADAKESAPLKVEIDGAEYIKVFANTRATYFFSEGVPLADYGTLAYEVSGEPNPYTSNIALIYSEKKSIDWTSAEDVKTCKAWNYMLKEGANEVPLSEVNTGWGNAAFDSSKYLVGFQIYGAADYCIKGITIKKAAEDAITTTPMEIKIVAADSETDASYTWTQHKVTTTVSAKYKATLSGATFENSAYKLPTGENNTVTIEFTEAVDLSKLKKLGLSFTATKANSYSFSAQVLDSDDKKVCGNDYMGAWGGDGKTVTEGSFDSSEALPFGGEGCDGEKGELDGDASKVKKIVFTSSSEFTTTVTRIKFM